MFSRSILVLTASLIPCLGFATTMMGDSGVSTTGNIITSSISLTTGATTWGYISSTGSYLPNLATNQISTSKVTNLGTPTGTSDAATKSYVDTVVAAAGAAAPAMCAATTTAYTGNLGGISGANTKCVSEFGSGWSFATGSKLFAFLMPSANFGTSQSLFGGAVWFQPSGSYSATNCTNWTSAATNISAYYLSSSSGAPYQNSNGCGSSFSIACCNF